MGAANLQVALAAGLLGTINPLTNIANTAANVVQTVGGDKVTQQAGQLTGIPSIDEALGFVGGTKNSSSWNGTFNWPVAGISNQSWITQDKLTVDSISSDEIKEKFSAGLNTPDYLKVQKGKTRYYLCGFKLCSEWVPTKDVNGNPVYAVTYDPNSQVANILATLDNVDVQGFSLIKREIGSKSSLPFDGSAGWLAGVTQVIVPGAEGEPDKVSTVPIMAAGFASPGDLFTVGGLYSPGIVTNGPQSIQSILGSRSSSFSIPRPASASNRRRSCSPSTSAPTGSSPTRGGPSR